MAKTKKVQKNGHICLSKAKWQKWKPQVFRGTYVLQAWNFIWQWPGLKVTSTESNITIWLNF